MLTLARRSPAAAEADAARTCAPVCATTGKDVWVLGIRVGLMAYRP